MVYPEKGKYKYTIGFFENLIWKGEMDKMGSEKFNS